MVSDVYTAAPRESAFERGLRVSVSARPPRAAPTGPEGRARRPTARRGRSPLGVYCTEAHIHTAKAGSGTGRGTLYTVTQPSRIGSASHPTITCHFGSRTPPAVAAAHIVASASTARPPGALQRGRRSSLRPGRGMGASGRGSEVSGVPLVRLAGVRGLQQQAAESRKIEIPKSARNGSVVLEGAHKRRPEVTASRYIRPSRLAMTISVLSSACGESTRRRSEVKSPVAASTWPGGRACPSARAAP